MSSIATGFPDPQLAIHAVGMPARFSCTVKPEDAGEVLRRLELLEAELAEAEDRIVHALNVLAHAVDFERDVPLVLVEFRIRGRRRGRRRLLSGRRRERHGDRSQQRDDPETRAIHEAPRKEIGELVSW